MTWSRPTNNALRTPDERGAVSMGLALAAAVLVGAALAGVTAVGITAAGTAKPAQVDKSLTTYDAR
jgi:hypothetical protein